MMRYILWAILALLTPALILLPAAQADSPFYPLVSARLLGGSGYEGGRDVAVANDGSIYVLGWTRTKSADNAGGADLLLAKFGLTGEPKWVHLLGGSQDEQPGGVAVGPGGSVLFLARLTARRLMG